MHFAALVALTVVASSVLGSAAPAPDFHIMSYPQVTSKRDDYIITYAASSDQALESTTAQGDDDSIIQNKRSQPLPAGGVQGTGSNNNQGIASDFGRRSRISGIANIYYNKDEVIEGASSGNAKRQAPESHGTFITIY